MLYVYMLSLYIYIYFAYLDKPFYRVPCKDIYLAMIMKNYDGIGYENDKLEALVNAMR